MNPEFEQCLKRNKIREFPRGKALLTKTLGIAQRDLERAGKTFNDKDYKWATIQSYYSMFHSARALLFAKNYREHSHYCLIVAMRALYVETRLLPGSLIEALGKGKRLREDADYYDIGRLGLESSQKRLLFLKNRKISLIFLLPSLSYRIMVYSG